MLKMLVDRSIYTLSNDILFVVFIFLMQEERCIQAGEYSENSPNWPQWNRKLLGNMSLLLFCKVLL